MQPLVGIIMGSRSDWETLVHTANTLDSLQVPYEVRVVSAHRTPDLLFEYASTAEARGAFLGMTKRLVGARAFETAAARQLIRKEVAAPRRQCPLAATEWA